MKKTKIQVLFLTNGQNSKLWDKYEKEFQKYFKMDVIKDTPKNITKYLDNVVDILFLDDPKNFKIEYYKSFKENDQSFSYIVLYDKINAERDTETYRIEIADRIIYTEVNDRLFKWEVISLLRRFWNTYSKPSTIIYKNIIADFVEQKFWINKKSVELTPKEASILRLLLLHKKEYVKKEFIFNEIWGFTEDNTRTVDQTIFKLKKKVGSEHFIITRNKGVMIK